jgi:hypothetical protein
MTEAESQPTAPSFPNFRLFMTMRLPAELGGFGTLAIMALWPSIFPQLRRVDRLKDVEAV